MEIPTLETERLILRKFRETDVDALYAIYSDVEVNQFLPWFPIKTMTEAEVIYRDDIAPIYAQNSAYHYAICLKSDDQPIGYVNVGTGDSHDLGYGLCKQFWCQGIVTEACKAVLELLRNRGIPYVTATHDVNNPRSGAVMRRLGMRYCYSYEEQWMPKNIPVTFRMYQLNLDGANGRVYQKYWDNSAVHFVEAGL